MSGLRSRRAPTTHHCDLQRGSESCLPKLPPQTGKLRRWLREMRKRLMVTAAYPYCQNYFRSRAAILSEKKRHLRSSNWYVIHPFSAFCICQERVMCLLWMMAFFKDPFDIAFACNSIDLVGSWKIVGFLVDLLMLINIAICFNRGTHNIQTKEVMLDFCTITGRYVKKYLFFDVFGTVPFHYIFGHFRTFDRDDVYYSLIACLHFLRFVRIKTMLDYLRNITSMISLGDTTHYTVCLVLLTAYFLHWCACFLYIVPKVLYGLYGSLPETSWVVMAGIAPGTNVTLTERYLQCMVSAMCHFFRAGTGMYMTEEPHEQVVFSFVMITGYFFFAFILSLVLVMMNSANASMTKYDELINQLKEFMDRKKLPPITRTRLITYYENRFQKHYFKEDAILSTLSDHLKYEMFVHTCQDLIRKVSLFSGLSKQLVSAIVGMLKQEVYLPNDIIFKAGSFADSIYFIDHGTVAVIMPNGREVCHLEDGDHIGEISMVVEEANNLRITSAVAVEITEVYRLDRKDFKLYVRGQEEIYSKFVKVAEERYRQYRVIHSDPESEAERYNIRHELRRGNILEHGHGQRTTGIVKFNR